MRTRSLAVAATVLGAAVLLLAGVLLFNTIGLVVAALVGSAVAVGVVRARLGSVERPARPGKAPPWPLEPFQSYQRIDRRISWGPDRRTPGTTRFLTRLAAAVLTQRHGIDLGGDPETARRLLGDHAWAVIDPTSSVDTLTHAEIEYFVDRLEQL